MIAEALCVLVQQIVEDPLMRHSAILVFANKQDLPNAMNAAEITDKLGLHSLRQRAWVRLQIHSRWKKCEKLMISVCSTSNQRVPLPETVSTKVSNG